MNDFVNMTSLGVGLHNCATASQPTTINPTHASTKMEGGKVKFQNDNYIITANDDSGVSIKNRKTGETTIIHGNSQVNSNGDGKPELKLPGDTTFLLNDGTKVTLKTTPDEKDKNKTKASRLIITTGDGDYGVDIQGLDSNKHGDLRFDEYKGKKKGQHLDALHADGKTIGENSFGPGWLAKRDPETGKMRLVDQDYLDKPEQIKHLHKHNDGTGLQDIARTLDRYIKKYIAEWLKTMGLDANGLPTNTSQGRGCLPPPGTKPTNASDKHAIATPTGKPTPTNPTHASTKMDGGKVKFDNDNYTITAGDNNTVTIYNKKTKETTKIHGDPHVDTDGDGKTNFDFWGRTTFNLEDGTKVTIETTPAGKDSKATLASRVIITNGDYGVDIQGVDSNKKGDLGFDEYNGGGKHLDALHEDGNRIYEDAKGTGYVTKPGSNVKVNQAHINETDWIKNPDLANGINNPTHASTKMIDGKVVFDNKNYTITAGDNNTVTIFNKKTKETTKIHGDPHVDVNGDGKTDFNFWGRTTFKLEDGTKVTIETTPAGKDSKATLASRVIITNGDYGVYIQGVDSNKHGDLRFVEDKAGGKRFDAAHIDGNVLIENPVGPGYLGKGNSPSSNKSHANDAFIDLALEPVTQAYMNKTDWNKHPELADKQASQSKKPEPANKQTPQEMSLRAVEDQYRHLQDEQRQMREMISRQLQQYSWPGFEQYMQPSDIGQTNSTQGTSEQPNNTAMLDYYRQLQQQQQQFQQYIKQFAPQPSIEAISFRPQENSTIATGMLENNNYSNSNIVNININNNYA